MKSLIEQAADIYEKRLAKLNARWRKAKEEYDPCVSGIDLKSERIEEQIVQLNREYNAITNANTFIIDNNNLTQQIRQQTMIIAELSAELGKYDPHAIDVIKRRWNMK